MRKVINIKFKFGDSVILKTDPGVIRQVTGYLIIPDTKVFYRLLQGDNETFHQDMEIDLVNGGFKVRGFAGSGAK